MKEKKEKEEKKKKEKQEEEEKEKKEKKILTRTTYRVKLSLEKNGKFCWCKY